MVILVMEQIVYPDWGTLWWFEKWSNDGIIIATLVSAIISLVTLFYIYSTFQSQRDLNSITIAKNTYDKLITTYEETYKEIVGNYRHKDNEEHVSFTYNNEHVIAILNELEILCLLVKTGSMKPLIMFELFPNLLMACRSDEKITSKYSDNVYNNLDLISSWHEKYRKSRLFNFRYRFRRFGLMRHN